MCHVGLVSALSKINLLLLERISLAGINRVMGVSESWLQNHGSDLYAAVEAQVTITLRAVGKCTVQMDELWLFVDNKGNKLRVAEKLIGRALAGNPPTERADELRDLLLTEIQPKCQLLTA